VAEDVGEPADLGCLLLGDHGHVVAAVENRSPPAGETVDLAGQFRLEVPHEPRQLPGVVDLQEQVKVRRQYADPADPHVVAALRTSEDAEEEVVEFGAGPEEISPLESAAGDEHEGR
jgi:hypothetical protein